MLSSPGWEEGGNEFSANVHSSFQMNLLSLGKGPFWMSIHYLL